jgi:hypothetical protein
MSIVPRLLLLTALLLGLSFPAFANIKILVTVTKIFYATSEIPDPNGTQVCGYVTLDPFGAGTVDVRTTTVCGPRTTLVASTMCAALKTNIITAAIAEYPTLSLVADNVAVQGCPQ